MYKDHILFSQITQKILSFLFVRWLQQETQIKPSHLTCRSSSNLHFQTHQQPQQTPNHRIPLLHFLHLLLLILHPLPFSFTLSIINSTCLLPLLPIQITKTPPKMLNPFPFLPLPLAPTMLAPKFLPLSTPPLKTLISHLKISFLNRSNHHLQSFWALGVPIWGL